MADVINNVMPFASNLYLRTGYFFFFTSFSTDNNSSWYFI